MADDRDKKINQIVALAEDKSIPLSDKVLSLAKSYPESYGSIKLRKVLAVEELDWEHQYSSHDRVAASGVCRKWYYKVQKSPAYKAASAANAILEVGVLATPAAMSLANQVRQGDTRACVAVLQKVDALDKPQSGNTSVTVQVTVEQLEQRRAESQKQGFNRLGFKIPQPVGGDN